MAGVGAALGETPVGGEVSITGLINGPQANATQLLITGASRWSSPGHPNRLGVRLFVGQGGPAQSVRGLKDVPLLVGFGTSSADGGSAHHSHCLSQSRQAVARPI